MRKIISLRLGWGSLESGFLNILVKIYQEDKLIEEIDIGSLPPNHEIAKNYQKWQWLYNDLIANSGSFDSKGI